MSRPDAGPAVARVRALAEQRLDGRRYRHCVGAAETASALCERYGYDADSGYLAGLAHDLCKQSEIHTQIELARSFDGPLPESVFSNPRLPHGPAAAVLLAREGLSTDPAVLEAVAYHTFGKSGMGPVALAVYIADKIEPSRRDWASTIRLGIDEGRFDGDGGLVRLATATIEAMLDRIVAEDGRPVADTTLVLYNSLSGKSVREWPVR
jgi:nicotinate-nucleotide adenylyltransferase